MTHIYFSDLIKKLQSGNRNPVIISYDTTFWWFHFSCIFIFILIYGILPLYPNHSRSGYENVSIFTTFSFRNALYILDDSWTWQNLFLYIGANCQRYCILFRYFWPKQESISRKVNQACSCKTSCFTYDTCIVLASFWYHRDWMRLLIHAW